MKLLKFYATWCGPCKALSMTMNRMADKITVPVEEIDIDQDMATAVKYQVRGVPTLVLVDDTGAEIKRQAGAPNENQLLQFLEV